MEELNAQAKLYFDLQAQIAALQEQAEAIKDYFKAQMVEQTVEDLRGEGWSATWHNTTTSRFDTTGFKKAHADLYAAFCKTTTGTRFTLVATKV